MLEAAGAIVIVVGAVQIFQGLSGQLPQPPQPAEDRSGGAGGHAGRTIRLRGAGSRLRDHRLVSDTDRDGFGRASYHDVGAALGVVEKVRFGGLLLGIAGAGLAAYGMYLVLLGLFRAKTR